MMQEKLKEIRDLLTEVKYPGTSKNIVELDMVQNIRIEGEKVLFRLVFQKAGDPFVGSVKKKAEALIKEKRAAYETNISMYANYFHMGQNGLQLPTEYQFP